MTGPALVSRFTKVIKAITIAWERGYRKAWKFIKKRLHCIRFIYNINISCVDYYRRKLCHTDISQQASSLISSSRRESPLSNYPSSWKKWSRWCTRQEIYPFYKILSKTFHRSIGCFKSSISACHAHIDEKPVGHQLFLLNDRNFQQLTQKAAPFVCVECRISFEVYKEQLGRFWELIREVFDI